jgi:hypothetical protein
MPSRTSRVALERILKDFGRAVLGGFEASDGMPAARLAAVERRLHLTLPSTLRRFHALVGRHDMVTSASSRFLWPPTVENGAVVFLEENQNVVFWGILFEDLVHDDPPVRQGNTAEARWYLDARRLSSFLLGAVSWQVANGLRWTAQGKLRAGLRTRLEAHLKAMDPGLDRVNDLSGYYGADLVVSVSRSARRFLVGSSERDTLQRFERTFGADLDHL